MKQISLNELVEFNKMSEKRKKNFVATLKKVERETKSEDSGNYWVSSISALKAYFRDGDKESYGEKIINLEDKTENTKIKHVRDQFQRNVNIMRSYEDVDFSKWKPACESTVIKNQTKNYITSLKGFEIKAAQWLVFEFKENDISKIGGIWFVAQKDGYKKPELGMFTEILYRYLRNNYTKKHEVDPKLCVAIDVIKGLEVNYEQIKAGEVSPMLIPTLNSIRKII
jgi:hypothetical protein